MTHALVGSLNFVDGVATKINAVNYVSLKSNVKKILRYYQEITENRPNKRGYWAYFLIYIYINSNLNS